MVKKIGILLGVLLWFLAVLLVVAFPFMSVWNTTIVRAISIARPVQYWDAFIILLLFAMLCFGGGGKST